MRSPRCTAALTLGITPHVCARYGSWYLLGSVMVSTKLASPIMRAQGSGSIIFNGSMAAQQANHGDPLYSAAKAGMSNYTKSAARKTDP